MTRNLEDIIQLLKNPLFEGMTEEILGEIASVVREEVTPAGSKIYRQNDAGNDYYIIETGRVRVYRESETGIEIDLNELGPGDGFGEIALVTDRPRSATIEALEETHLLVLNKEQFDHILENHPRIYANVVKFLSEILARDESQLEEEAKTRYEAPSLSWIDYAVLIGIILGIALVFNYTNPNGLNVLPEFYDSDAFPKISLSAAKEKYDSKKTVFIDARPDNFYNQKHIKGAINLPLPLFDIMYMMSGLTDIEIDEEDLKIETFQAGGAGEKNENKTGSAVRLTHIPTGIVAESQDEESQQLNKEWALEILKDKLPEDLKDKLLEQKMDKEIIIYGRAISAYYDEDVAKKLDLRGHKNIKIMKGPAGVAYYMKALMYSGWEKAGYPMTTEETSDSE